MISYVGIWYDGTTRFDVLYGKNMVHDRVYVGGMAYGKNTVCGTVLLAVWEKRSTWYVVWYVGGMV